jgi:phenylacetate-CoA ligase
VSPRTASVDPRLRTEPFDALDRRTPAGLQAFWRRRLREVLEIAWEEMPFHRRRFEAAGFHPSQLRSLADLARVPLFDKAAVLAEQRRLGRYDVGLERASADPGMVLSSSSGTRGTTFLAHPPRWRRVQGRSALRAHWWAGLRPGTRFLLSAPAWHSYAAVQTWIAERLGLPCVVVSGTYLPRFAGRIVDALLAFRPRFVTMFLPMVFSLVSEARRRGLPPREAFASVETIAVAGAPITPGMREALRGETGVQRFVEIAGSTESLLAIECRAERGLHVVPDTCYVEVLDPRSGAPAEPRARGRVAHTCLVPWGSTYLRYDGGDTGVCDDSPCPCGLPSPRIKLLGRAEDAFRLGDAELLPYDVQLAVEESEPGLAGTPCLVLREGLAAGRLELVMPRPETGYAPGLDEALAHALRARFGAPAEVRFVESLPLLFKGVPPVLSARDLQGSGGAHR